MTRPAIEPSVVAAITQSVPARLVKKLDGDPALAEKWTWAIESDVVRVTTENGETVSASFADGAVREATAVKCSCLLSPRCLHVLAVITRLTVNASPPGLDESHSPQPPLGGRQRGDENAGGRVEVTAAMRAIAVNALRAAGDVVRAGCAQTGAVVQAELLRVAHGARSESAHRLGASAVRVVAAARALRAEDAGFTLEAFTEDLRDLLATAHALANADTAGVEAKWIGVARRPYDDVGTLQLAGLLCEPVISSRGYAGVVTHLCDQLGRVWTVNEVMPGQPSRAIDAYDAPAAIGDATLPHRQLAREGLFVQNATGSMDGRLGSGAAVRAVRAQRPSRWNEGGIARRFGESLDAQLDRAFTSLALPIERRPRGDTLLFARLVVLGADRDALCCSTRDDGRVVRVVAPSDHAKLAYRDNLRMLARAPGLAIRVVGDIVPEASRAMTSLALAADEPVDGADGNAPRLVLDEAWGDRVHLGYETLQSAHIERVGARAAVLASEGPVAPEVAMLEPLARWRDRVAMHGVAGLPAGARGRVEDDVRKLARRAMPWGERTLIGLARACASDAPTESLAPAWLAVAAYVDAASRALARSAWDR